MGEVVWTVLLGIRGDPTIIKLLDPSCRTTEPMLERDGEPQEPSIIGLVPLQTAFQGLETPLVIGLKKLVTLICIGKASAVFSMGFVEGCVVLDVPLSEGVDKAERDGP